MTGEVLVDYSFDEARAQALLLRAPGELSHTRYLFLELHPRRRLPQTRQWLRSLLDSGLVHNGRTFDADTRSNVNIAFTRPGLDRLGIGYVPAAGTGHHDAFSEGMRNRAEAMFDVGDSGADRWNWDQDWAAEAATLDAMVWITAADADERDRATAAVLGTDDLTSLGAVAAGRLLGHQDAQLRPSGYSHFGFTDGTSQPFVRKVHDPDNPAHGLEGGGVFARDGKWRAVELGEFMLGYPGEGVPSTTTTWDYDGPRPVGLPATWFHDGTFVVYRKLEQHVDRWIDFLDRHAPEFARIHGLDVQAARELMAAQVVGRYPDELPAYDGDEIVRIPGTTRPGRPLTSCLDGTDDDYGEARNRFRYEDDDAVGGTCPFGAHIRRGNPRDALGHPRLASRHRIIRRSYPYGETPDEHGLIFVGVCANIEEQFEFVRREWINTGRPFHVGSDPDPIAGVWDTGTGPRKVVLTGDEPFIGVLPQPLLTVRGGEYFFAPGMRALTSLAADM